MWKQFIERASFRLTSFIVSIIEREDGAKRQLLASPRKLGIRDRGVDHLVADSDRAGYVFRSHIQSCEMAAIYLNVFEKMLESLVVDQEPGGIQGCNSRESRDSRSVERFLFEPPRVTLLEHSQAWFQRPAQIAYLIHQAPTEPIRRIG